jgi:SAM-dependent methyltransferase
VGLSEYCAAGQHAIEGWLQDDALLLTLALHRQQRLAGIAGGIAEIGVHHGRFFVALALLCGGDERALAVDVFADQHLNPDGSGRGDRAVFEANLAQWGVADRTVVRQGDSLALAASEVRAALGGAGARLFSVDGGHALRHADNDLRVAAASLAPGGVVLLDDFLHAGWLGVTEAAVLMLHGEAPPLLPVAICGGKLALAAPADHAAWMGWLGERVAPMAREAERVRFCGVECWRLWLRPAAAEWELWPKLGDGGVRKAAYRGG